jgi:hypothetical protein
MKGDEIDGACSKYENIKMHTKFWLKIRKERYHLKDLGVNGDNIKMKVNVTLYL